MKFFLNFLFLNYFLFSQEVQLILRSGEILKGELHRLNEGVAELKTGKKIQQKNILSLYLGGKSVPSLSKSNYWEFSDGSRLAESQSSLKGQDFSFIWGNKQLFCNRSNLLSYYKIKNKPLNYSISPVRQNGINVSRNLLLLDKEKSFWSSSVRGIISENFSWSCSIDFLQDNNASFSYSFWRGRQSFKVVIKDNLVFWINDNKVEYFFDKKRQAKRKIVLSYNAEQKSWVTYVGHKLITTIAVNDDEAYNLQFNGVGVGLVIGQVELSNYLAYYQFTDEKLDHISFGNSDFINAEVIGIDKDNLEVNEPLGRYQLPMKNLGKVYFNNSISKLKSKLEIYMKNQQRLFVKSLDMIDEKFVKVDSEIFGEMIISRELVELIVFP